MNAIRQAADRLRANEYRDAVTIEKSEGSFVWNYSFDRAKDNATLADFALPLLDETEIPDDLTTVGFKSCGREEWPRFKSPLSKRGGPCCQIIREPLLGCDGWFVGDEGEAAMITPPNTMGELRMLAAGLGITLKEKA